jgi:serine/threonine-protein kinase
MALSRTITEPPSPPRREQPHDEPTRRPVAAQFRIARVSGDSPQPTTELEEQLRKRLRFSILVVVAYYVAMIGIGLSSVFHRLLTAPMGVITEAPGCGIDLLVVCLETIIAVRLSPRRPLNLAQLRRLEWLALAPVVAYTVWCEVVILVAWLTEVDKEPFRLACALATGWALMVVGYGVVIPNTWRRCAAIVGLIALAGFLPDVFVVLGNGAFSQPAFVFLASKAMWLAIAGAIAVYGSFRIEILRQEAVQARKLGQYLLKDRLGAGGMGEVYLAEHLLLRRPCAIKLIRPEHVGDPKNLLRFEREVQTTATLTHPNTVQIFDYGHADDGTFYYVMEHLPGLALDQMVSRHGPLPAARAVHFLRQVCGALREAHAVGLIHRDIKPGNVMVCERGGLHDVAKLLDFGLVLAPGAGPDGERLTQVGVISGTPAYMSPEQAGGREDLDARSDIYSLGCLAYFLLTGRPPFADRAAVGMVAAHMYEPPAPLTSRRADVPEELQAVVLRCLAKAPAERFASALDLDAALAVCQAGRPWTDEDARRWWRANDA